MNIILDIHTHAPMPALQAVGAFMPCGLPPQEAFPGQVYSAGLHPWATERLHGLPEESLMLLAEALARPDVVALGECGIDLAKGGELAIQRILFRRQALMAGDAGKPMVIHCVRAQEHILGMHSDLRPGVPWAIHGFRGKPQVAEMFLKKGIWLSFGPKFNPDTLRMVPAEYLLAETDDSGMGINEVISLMEETRCESLVSLLAVNADRFLHPNPKARG